MDVLLDLRKLRAYSASKESKAYASGLRCGGLILGIAILWSVSAPAAPDALSLPRWQERRQKGIETAMLVLGGWAIANVAASGATLGGATGRARAFREMNIYWNAVNLGIAAYGYFSARSGETTWLGSSIEHAAVERFLWLNVGLDVAYVTAGFFLRERGARLADDRQLGFGDSLLLQGGFLLAFDIGFAYWLRGLGGELLPALAASPGGIAAAWRF